jgi:hypothetical protein
MLRSHPLVVLFIAHIILALFNILTDAGKASFTKQPFVTLIGWLAAAGLCVGIAWLVFSAAGLL